MSVLRLRRGGLLIGALLASLCGHALSAADIDFAHDIVPIVRERCGACHTGDKKQGGYSMNARSSFLAGGESGPAVVVGKSGSSELMRRITSNESDFKMPPEGPRLTAEQIALLKRWIDAGAPWQDGFAFKKAGYDPPLKPRRPELPPARPGRDNPVDRILDAYLAGRQLPPGRPLDDDALVRRMHLDVVGLLPTPEQLDKFLADPSPDKRQRLVRDLLADDVAYAEHWLTFWNDLLRNDYTGTGFITGGRKQITGWLYRSLVTNKPYDQFVRELIAPTAESEGFIQGIRWRGNVSASQTQEVQFAQSICQSLLGINMKCASCHDSFIDRWTLDEAYGLAAIYAREPLAIHRCDKPTGKHATPAWIFPEIGQVDPKAPQPERLKQLAALMTHPDNGRLTRTIVNRIWHRLMGRGIVHPTDAMHTEPWHADLLDYLAVHLADNRYDLKQTISLICSSQTYQSRAAVLERSADDKQFVFQGPLTKRLTAEQFVDAVWQLTGAGPTKIDAPVQRGKADAAAVSGVALQGKWVWSSAQASTGAPARETLTFRKRVTLNAPPIRASAVITCDNGYTLFVNGKKVAADDNWESVETVPLASELKAGENEIVIVAVNGGEGANPAGLFFEARVRTKDAESAIGTDATWEWTNAKPDGRGRFVKPPTEWKPAAEIANPSVWTSRVGNDLTAGVAHGQAGDALMVRASLVKSDALMRSLGRPNRDQIVTMRPSEMTTLEAIDLANAQVLADVIQRGADRRFRELADGETSESLATRWYRFALSRAPTAEELAVAREILGDKPTTESVADLLWSILMLPEFQLVR